MMVIKPEVDDNDFEAIREIVETILADRGGKIDPAADGRNIANRVLAELGRRDYVVMKATKASSGEAAISPEIDVENIEEGFRFTYGENDGSTAVFDIHAASRKEAREQLRDILSTINRLVI